ncbi:hypothetical protein ACFLRY_01205 [Bacteroidota bacterium]
MKYLIHYSEFSHSALEEFVDAILSRQLKFYASEFVMDFDLKDIHIQQAVRRAVRACAAMNIPPSKHFRKVYLYDDEILFIDWRLSPYGCYLLLLNCDPSNPLISKFQSSLIVGN